MKISIYILLIKTYRRKALCILACLLALCLVCFVFSCWSNILAWMFSLPSSRKIVKISQWKIGRLFVSSLVFFPLQSHPFLLKFPKNCRFQSTGPPCLIVEPVLEVRSRGLSAWKDLLRYHLYRSWASVLMFSLMVHWKYIQFRK